MSKVKDLAYYIKLGKDLELSGNDLQQFAEKTRNNDIDLEDRRRQEDLDEKKRIEELQERHRLEDLEEKKRIEGLEDRRLAEQRHFELEKLKIEKTNSAKEIATPALATTVRTKHLDKNLKNLVESDDIGIWFKLFESTATMSGILKEHWPLHLPHKMYDSLRDFIIHTDLIHCSDYEHVKLTILRNVQCSEETFRLKWTSLAPQGDNFREYYVSLTMALDGWLKCSDTPNTYDGLRNLILMGRISNEVSDELLERILQAKPKSPEEMLKIIDVYKIAAKGKRATKNHSISDEQLNTAAATFVPRYNNAGPKPTEIHCYNCGRKGHIRNQCRVRSRSIDRNFSPHSPVSKFSAIPGRYDRK